MRMSEYIAHCQCLLAENEDFEVWAPDPFRNGMAIREAKVPQVRYKKLLGKNKGHRREFVPKTWDAHVDDFDSQGELIFVL